ncbi:MAG: hypothetical protein ACT4QE_09850, partial [Anaerolineales bacterium]
MTGVIGSIKISSRLDRHQRGQLGERVDDPVGRGSQFLFWRQSALDLTIIAHRVVLSNPPYTKVTVTGQPALGNSSRSRAISVLIYGKELRLQPEPPEGSTPANRKYNWKPLYCPVTVT